MRERGISMDTKEELFEFFRDDIERAVDEGYSFLKIALVGSKFEPSDKSSIKSLSIIPGSFLIPITVEVINNIKSEE